MSISTLQEKLFNKGCGSVLIVVAAAAMGVSMFTGQCNNPSANLTEAQRQDAVAMVDGAPVLGSRIQTLAAQQQASMGDGGGVAAQAQALVGATGTALRTAATQALIAKGPALTEAEIMKAGTAFANGLLDQAKIGLLSQKKIASFNPTDAELEKALKVELQGKTLAQFRADRANDAKAAFNDPQRKNDVIALLGDNILAARYGAEATGDDAKLKDSYRTYVVKRIFLSDRSGSIETAKSRADKALASLKSGTAFDKLMDTVSNDPASPGRPVHETTESVPLSLLDTRPELKDLKGKTAGATTGIVDVPGGKAIYRLVSIGENLPTDFEKNKEKYRAEKAQQAGQAEVQKRVADLLASDEVRWESEGYRALGMVYNAVSGTGPNAATLDKAIEVAKAAVKGGKDPDRRLGAQALLVASAMSGMTPGADPAKTKAARLETLEAVQAAGIQDPSLSLELADLYAEKKDGAKATQALLDASKGNARYDTEGERVFRDIAAKALKYQSDKAITADQLKSVQAQQAIWSNARAENEKASAEAKKAEEAARKANEAEIARQKAEAAKNAPKPSENGAKAPATGGPTTGSAPPAPATTTTTGGSLLPTSAGGQ